MRKWILFLLFISIPLILLSAYAQPSLCTVTGTIYRGTGVACASCQITISKASADGVAISGTAETKTTNGSGVISFTAVQGSFIKITGGFTIRTYDFTSGLVMYVPRQSSVNLEDLKTQNDALLDLLQPTTFAPADATFITQVPSADLAGEQALSLLADGLMKKTTGGVVATATGGTDYEFPLTFAARLTRSTNTIDLATSGVTAGSCTACDLTVDQYGRVTAKASGSGGGVGTHSLLSSAVHTDTTTGTVARGDLITGQGGTATWTRLALGASGRYLRSDGTDAGWNTIQAADLPTGIDAAKLADGTVSNTELQRLDGVTSSIQSQIDGKASTALSNLASVAINTDLVGAVSGGLGIRGGSAANDDLILEGTTNGTRTTSYVNLQPNGGFVGIGTSAPAGILDVNSWLSFRTGGVVGNGRQHLFMNPSAWLAGNPGFTMDQANSFHFYDDGELRVEFESGNSLMQFYIESGVGFDSWYGLQEGQTHHWSFGQKASQGGNLEFHTGFGLSGGLNALTLSKTTGSAIIPVSLQGPTSPLIIDGTGLSDAPVYVDNYGSAGSGFASRRARGTKTAPTAVQSGDVLSGMFARGHDGTSFPAGSSGYLRFAAAENFTGSAKGTSLEMATTPTGSTSASVRMSINPSGLIAITNSLAQGFAVGPNGATNPAVDVVTNIASAANGYRFTGRAAGTPPTLEVISSGGNEGSSFLTKGTGFHSFRIGNDSAPASSWTSGLTISQVIYREPSDGSLPLMLAAAGGSAAGTRTGIVGRRSRGTLASPTAVVDADELFAILAAAYDGSAFQSPAQIEFLADGTPSSGSAAPARFSVQTGTNSGDRTERIRVTSGGNIGLNSSAFGTSAAKVVSIGQAGTAPTTRATDAIQIWGFDYVAGDTRLRISPEAGAPMAFGSDQIAMSTGGSNPATATYDWFLGRSAAATFRFGEPDTAAAVAQTFTVQGVAGGNSNVAGANTTWKASPSTGNAAGGNFIFQVTPAGSSGTSQNSFSTAFTIESTRTALFGTTWRAAANSPSQITSNQNDYSIATPSYFQRLNTDQSRLITGIATSPAQTDGQVHLLTNSGSLAIVLPNENAGSTAGNRFTGLDSADTVLMPGAAVPIIYDGTSSRWRPGRDGGLSPSVLVRKPLMAVEFMQTGAAPGDWRQTAISSGTNTTAPASGVVTGNHPGVVLLRSSTSANSGYRYDTITTNILLGGGERFDLVFRTPADLTNTTIRFGFHDLNSSTDAVDGCYFELPSTGAVVGKCANNSTRTTSSTIATLSVDTWYHAVVAMNYDATSAVFTIYSEAGASLGTQTVSTNIPTAAGREVGAGVIATNSATTAVDLLNLDYMSVAWLKALVRGQ